MTFSFAIEGRPAPNPSGREDPVPLRAVMPDYFRTLGIPLVHGRTIEPTDREDSPAGRAVQRSARQAILEER